jgi:3-oxoadipate enol-lactonase
MNGHITTGDSVHIGYELTGKPTGAPLIFLHSLGSDHNQWRPQIDALTDEFHVLAVDARGHGLSDAPAGDYALDRMATDIIEVADHVGMDTFHLCGLSVGGLMAQWIAINHSDRLRTLTLANTAAKIGSAEVWNERANIALTNGVGSMIDVILARWFLPPFAAQHRELTASLAATLTATSSKGYAGTCAALSRADLRSDVRQITTRTLLIASSDDGATPPTDLEFLHANIAGSTYHLIEDAAHISNLEAPDHFTRVLRTHLTQ